MTQTTERSASLVHLVRSGWRQWLLELLVVFVGVSGAFIADNIRDERITRSNRVEYVLSLRNELSVIAATMRASTARIDSIRAAFRSALAMGTRPRPAPATLTFRHRYLVVNAAFQGVDFFVLGNELINNLSGGSTYLRMIELEYDAFESRTVHVLLPNMNKGTEEFYDGKTLRPKYAWYLESLDRLSEYQTGLVVMIERSAIPDINVTLESLR